MVPNVPPRRATLARDAAFAIVPALCFAYMAWLATRPEASAVDAAIRDRVHGLSLPAITLAMKLITNLGSGWLLYPTAGIIVLELRRKVRHCDALLLAATVSGAVAAEHILKYAFHRARPDPFFGYGKPDSYSFPSGHALVSFCFYASLAEVLIRPGWSAGRKAAIRVGALLLAGIIGLSRIYLGVHFPTDVLGGFALAIVWMVLVRAAHRRWWRSEEL